MRPLWSTVHGDEGDDASLLFLSGEQEGGCKCWIGLNLSDLERIQLQSMQYEYKCTGHRMTIGPLFPAPLVTH